MYITSKQFDLVSEKELAEIEQQNRLTLPKQYRNFLTTYGMGTYGGNICVQTPDFELLKEYAEYDFWEHENAPITREQTKECVVIGNSIDGDYIALHPEVEGYILLPRHSDTIILIPYGDEGFVDTLVNIGHQLYQEELEDYFEPAGSRHLFLHPVNKESGGIYKKFKAVFQYDYLIENEYMCNVFLYRMGGYVRFDLCYGHEAAVFYSSYGTECFHEVEHFLKENGYQ